MDNTNLPLNHPHHTKLIATLVVLVILTVIFFTLKQKNTEEIPRDTTAQDLYRVVELTSEQRSVKEAALADPSLMGTRKLSPADQKQKEQLLKSE